MVFLEIKDNIKYISVDTNIGIIKSGNSCILIDAGGSKDDGIKILRVLEEENLPPNSVIITHGHWDHFYGITKIIEKFPKLKVYSSSIEKAFIENPYLEFYSYFSSTSPLKVSDTPFEFRGIKVDEVIDKGTVKIDNEEMEIIPLSGHSPLGLGILYKRVLFSGDCLYSVPSLNMFKMPFYTDIESQYRDLDILSDYEIEYCLPAHGLPIRGSKNFKNALIENRKKLESLEKMILDLIKEGISEEQLKKQIAEKLSIKFDFTKYIYVTITTKAFLHYLYNTGKADFEIEDGILLWKN
ncbi:MAG: hydroxyacylglutathione hydrolase [Candidatus Methanofastidiosum methylothiophilum]|uniref:Hydroxyacylglutathione hydrolase n=1 Tax=Candidatus Methanofastidiosum methylothiophilum TaxID=1705564 RepID=A0A150J265_9EURY|nr:MAG: hydroxyacylglutathione hydrolase [Candidatus Methanofastidiosum methylthiophilus]KYC48610.1 MAG: hydroxyacylglutathione hydrolase [Candidatus Methanofastidiosum methylthiophilus]KYC51185.1 MAG: hydroxyacylglutathione hydrolase [Candidatus Methanofastidiosum methylthiophilus]